MIGRLACAALALALCAAANAVEPAAETPAAAAAPEEAVFDPAEGVDAALVARRFLDAVPDDLEPYFDLYLYVSKAAAGPWAQRMVIFDRQETGALALREVILVSTGRERQERYFTRTPVGLFKLDPNRFHRIVYSRRWDNAPMPHAMFLEFRYRVSESGVALHAATGRAVRNLGRRNSGGCVRLPPDKAEALFGEIRDDHRGLVPSFAYDPAAGTTSRWGMAKRYADGALVLSPGFKVLLLIEDEPGVRPGPLALAQ